jgi:hypothetical protein
MTRYVLRLPYASRRARRLARGPAVTSVSPVDDPTRSATTATPQPVCQRSTAPSGSPRDGELSERWWHESPRSLHCCFRLRLSGKSAWPGLARGAAEDWERVARRSAAGLDEMRESALVISARRSGTPSAPAAGKQPP